HVGLNQFLHPGVPDPDPHPPVIRSQHRIDRAQAVMAGAPAAALYPELAGAQIDLVMYRNDILLRDLKKAGGVAHRSAGCINKGLWLKQEHPLAADRCLREFALEAATKTRDPEAPSDRVYRHEPDIVAVSRVASTRVAETDEEAHSACSGRCRFLGS